MNFQQLRIIRETIRQNFNLTQAAEALYTSQSGLSKHIKDLEDELGVVLFVRRGKRLLGLTEAGKALSLVVDRMLLDAGNLKKIADEFSQADRGELVIATTHTQARYILPPIVAEFKKRYPKVHLVLQQASPTEVSEMLLAGEADIGIATESLTTEELLYSVPYYQWYHHLITPLNHPLAQLENISLQDIAEYPIITYHGGFTGRSKIDRTFKEKGIHPDIVMSALDADVIKTYVELDLGVGIIASIAYNPQRDNHIEHIPIQFFGENTTWIAVRRGHLLRGFAYEFIQLCRQDINLDEVIKAAQEG